MFFAPLILIVAVVVGIIYVVQSGGVGGFLDKANELHGLGMGEAITAVVGSWIAGAVMGVDMFRFNKSTKAVWGCAAACFILTNPILNIVGYIGTVYIGNFELCTLDAWRELYCCDFRCCGMDNSSLDNRQ